MNWLFWTTFSILASYVFAGGDPALEIRIQTLELQLKTEIQQLNSTGFGHLTQNLEKYEAQAKSLLDRAQKTDDRNLLHLINSEYLHLKHDAEHEMHEIQRDQKTIDDLKRKAATLKARIDANIAQLKPYNMTTHIEILEIDKQRLDALFADMRNVTSIGTVRHLEEAIHELERHVEHDLDRAEHDLRHIHHFYATLVSLGIERSNARMLTKIPKLHWSILAAIELMQELGFETQRMDNLSRLALETEKLSDQVQNNFGQTSLIWTKLDKLIQRFNQEYDGIKSEPKFAIALEILLQKYTVEDEEEFY